MVKKDIGWYPAYRVGNEGDDYKICYVGSDGETIVRSENVRHLFAGKPIEKIPAGLFKKN
jgi:hypothetical protein